MKTKNILLALAVLLFASTGWTKEMSINQTIAGIDADAQKPGGPERALKSISASTHVPVATLEKEKASSGVTYGELYIAHAIASASGKSFTEIVKLKKQGKTWDKIADDNNVSLGGKKVKKMTEAKPSPSPRSMQRTPSSQPTPDQSSGYKMQGPP
jgi:hypothetical protein